MAEKRLFTFGCSYTNFYMYTWADIMGRIMEPAGYKFYNMGASGLGNAGIFYTMIRANDRYKFTEHDKIMVVFSSWAREDRWWPKTGLEGRGGIMLNPSFEPDFVEKYWSMENDVMKNYSCISAVRSLFDFSFEGFIGDHDVDQTALKHDPDLVKYLQAIKRAHRNPFLSMSALTLDNTLSPLNQEQYDLILKTTGHPLPHHHLGYVLNVIAPHMNLEVPDSVVSWVKDAEAAYGAGCGTTPQECEQHLLNLNPESWDYFWELWGMDENNIYDWPQLT
jgi:hypothetical protein